MIRTPSVLHAVLALWLGGCALAVAQPHEASPTPLPRAHSHNDYSRPRPLLAALDNGFCSVEADIFCIEGALLVAHNREDCVPERTLEALYLDPLRARVQANGGRVYPKGPVFTLLIDIKDNGERTYARLREVLASYAELLTVFTPDNTEAGAVMVILSGSAPRDTVAAEPRRLVAIDGRPTDLAPGANRNLVPLVSESWASVFQWRGQGEIPQAELDKLRGMVQAARANGQRIRFWGLPVRPAVIPVLYEAGVDLLNTDNVPGLRAYLVSTPGGTEPAN